MYRLPVFLLISAIHVTTQDTESFRYPETGPLFYRRSSPYQCTICDAYDCLKMDDAKCEYYREVNRIQRDKDQDKVATNPAMKAEVDELLLDLAIKESCADRQCIPHVSSYTNCNKHNICLGCTRCDCSAAARWECRKWQQCRHETPPDVDHRLLVQLMEFIDNASRDMRTKAKRSIHANILSKGTGKEENFTSQEISSIINGLNNTFDVKQIARSNDGFNAALADRLTDTATESDESMNNTEKNDQRDPSDLEFDELFPAYYNLSIGYAAKLLLPMLKNHTEDILDPDYMDTTDDNVTDIDKETIDTMLDFNNLDANPSGTLEANDVNDIFERQAVRVVKRQITNITRSLRNKILLNNSKRSIQELTENVLHPLISFINTKRNELKELEYMRDNLQEYIRLYIRNETFLKINKTLLENITKSYVTFYKMEILPKIQNDKNQNKPVTLEEYESKLEKDIYEVINDVIGIQENSHYKELPENLYILIQAMKYYIHKQGKLHVMKEFRKITENNMNVYKKFIEDNSNEFAISLASNVIKQILTVVDKEMPPSNAFAPLSMGAKKMLRRIINYKYADKYDLKNHSAFNPPYNMVKDLKDVGIKWYKMTRGVASSRLSDRLYSMKLLHLEISKDICKIKDAIAFVEYSQSRRVMAIDKDMSERYATRIGEDVKIVNTKIQEIIKQQNDNSQRNFNQITIATPKPKSKKESFMQQVKKLLRKSKKDIGNIFKSNLKDDLSKHIDNVKWQRDTKGTLNRNKRSPAAFNKVIRRMKNIIPNYLKRKFSGDKNYKLVTKNLKAATVRSH